jgi:hypothetical protein
MSTRFGWLKKTSVIRVLTPVEHSRSTFFNNAANQPSHVVQTPLKQPPCVPPSNGPPLFSSKRDRLELQRNLPRSWITFQGPRALTLFGLDRPLRSYQQAGPIPSRWRPIPLEVLRHACAIARAAADDHSMAAAGLTWIAVFFLQRTGEYLWYAMPCRCSPFHPPRPSNMGWHATNSPSHCIT